MAALAGQDPHLQQLITEALSNTCRKYFSDFKTNLTVTGTIGITVDNSHVCIVQVSDDLQPDNSSSIKYLGENCLDKKTVASQNDCVVIQTNSKTNNPIVIKPHTKKDKQMVQLWNNAETGNVHVSLPGPGRKTSLSTPENSSLLSLLTMGTKPEDRTVMTDKPPLISGIWGNATKIHGQNSDQFPSYCNDAALDLSTASEHGVMDKLCCVSPPYYDGTCDNSRSTGNPVQFRQQLTRTSVVDGVIAKSSRLPHPDDINFASATKRIKIEAVKMSTKQCSSSPRSNDCPDNVQMSNSCNTVGNEGAIFSRTAHALNIDGRLREVKPVVRTEQDEVHNKNISAFVDIESLASASVEVTSEGAKVRVASADNDCKSEKYGVDLKAGTAMTMNDLVDFYIRKEIFHHRK